MRINPFLNLKSSAAGGEGCSGDCGKGERECSGSWCFSDAKVLLDYYRELRFYFSSPLDLQLDEIGLSSDVIPGMDGEVVWRYTARKKGNVQCLLKNVINKYFNNSYHEIVLRRRMKRVKISTDRHGLLL